jgi:hypothetical protein
MKKKRKSSCSMSRSFFPPRVPVINSRERGLGRRAPQPAAPRGKRRRPCSTAGTGQPPSRHSAPSQCAGRNQPSWASCTTRIHCADREIRELGVRGGYVRVVCAVLSTHTLRHILQKKFRASRCLPTDTTAPAPDTTPTRVLPHIPTPPLHYTSSLVSLLLISLAALIISSRLPRLFGPAAALASHSRGRRTGATRSRRRGGGGPFPPYAAAAALIPPFPPLPPPLCLPRPPPNRLSRRPPARPRPAPAPSLRPPPPFPTQCVQWRLRSSPSRRTSAS